MFNRCLFEVVRKFLTLWTKVRKETVRKKNRGFTIESHWEIFPILASRFNIVPFFSTNNGNGYESLCYADDTVRFKRDPDAKSHIRCATPFAQVRDKSIRKIHTVLYSYKCFCLFILLFEYIGRILGRRRIVEN